jgi:hypothetical protein
VIAQDVFAGTPLRRAPGEHRRQPADHLALFAVGRSALVLAGRELLQRPPGPLDARAQLLTGGVARDGGVGQPPQLRGLHLEPRLEPVGRRDGRAVRPTALGRHRAHDDADDDGQQHDADLFAHGILLRSGKSVRP